MPGLDELNTAELLLVTSLRLYAAPFRDKSRCHPDWWGGFVVTGIGPVAVPAFAALFETVSRLPRYPLEIGCPHCRGLGRDERKFLRLSALNQRGRLEEATAILGEWLPPTAALLASVPSRDLAFALAEGRLHLPLRAAPPPLRLAVPDRGLNRLQ